MKDRIRAVAGIAAAYTGTLFGAGFVSGQEILRFFASWGGVGVVGALLAGAGFAVIGIIVMMNARRLETSDYERIISPVGGLLPKIVAVLMSVWLFGIITVMLAAAGTLFHALTGLPALIGAAVLTCCVIFVHLLGTAGFSRTFSFVVPAMIVAGFGTAAAGAFTGRDAAFAAGVAQSFTVAPHWLVSTALYISYNILGTIGVLAPLARGVARDRDVKLGAILGGGIPGLFAALLCMAMLKNQSAAFSNDMPMFAIAKEMSPALGWIYAAALFLGIFTAAAGISFSLLSRLQSYKLPGILGKRVFVVPAVCLAALLGSSLGFASLVGTVYPAYGWLGFAVIALLCVNFFRARKLKQDEEREKNSASHSPNNQEEIYELR
jgi:uncharacterized membrane protein YkvI